MDVKRRAVCKICMLNRWSDFCDPYLVDSAGSAFSVFLHRCLPSSFSFLSFSVSVLYYVYIYNIINIANSQMPLIVASNLVMLLSDPPTILTYLELIGSRFARVTSRTRPVLLFARDWCQTTQTTSGLMSVCLPGCLSLSLSVSVCLFWCLYLSISLPVSLC